MGQYTTQLGNLHFQCQDGSNITQEILSKLQAVCPEALEATVEADIFPRTGGGPQAMAEQYKVPYWGVLPLDPNLLTACEQGKPFVEEHLTLLVSRCTIFESISTPPHCAVPTILQIPIMFQGRRLLDLGREYR
jgi:hypothetical protein